MEGIHKPLTIITIVSFAATVMLMTLFLSPLNYATGVVVYISQENATQSVSEPLRAYSGGHQGHNTEIREAFVTGYNTVPEQTDSTPCISATQDNICGREDVVACPYDIPLGTTVYIDGKEYQCLDRTHRKFNGRFDISCDKDFECPYVVTGNKEVVILR